MRCTYKFDEMVKWISEDSYYTWGGIDSYSDIPYINNYPNISNNPYHCKSMSLIVNEVYRTIESEEVRTFDLEMNLKMLSEMLPDQRLVFPVYLGCHLLEVFRYKYINGVFVLVSHFDNREN